MAIREIRVVPDPVLRTPCDEIKEITPAVRRLVDDLLETVDDPGRAGLSANQIGVSLRAFSYNIDGKVGYVLNPVLEEKSGEQYGDEGCLSVPGLWYKTRRADYARVRGIDLDGNEVVRAPYVSARLGRAARKRKRERHGSPYASGYVVRPPRGGIWMSLGPPVTPCATCAIVSRHTRLPQPSRHQVRLVSSPVAYGDAPSGACFFSTGSVLFSETRGATRQRTLIAGVQSHPILSTGTQQIPRHARDGLCRSCTTS